jgi:hypothetical protein
MTYAPVTLPPLPRKRCPAYYARGVQRYGSKLNMYIVKSPCTGKPLKNGWCAMHQYCLEMLERGARLGYPRMQVNEGLWIGAGIANWEGYAVCYAARQRENVLRAVLRIESEIKE